MQKNNTSKFNSVTILILTLMLMGTILAIASFVVRQKVSSNEESLVALNSEVQEVVANNPWTVIEKRYWAENRAMTVIIESGSYRKRLDLDITYQTFSSYNTVVVGDRVWYRTLPEDQRPPMLNLGAILTIDHRE